MDRLLSEFVQLPTEPTETTEPTEPTEPTERQIRDVKIDQRWVERAVHFSQAYSHLLTVEEVDRQFRQSEFGQMEQFLHYNQLFPINDHYVKVESKVTVLKKDLVEKCYREKGSKNSFQEFLRLEDISSSNDCFYRVSPSFPKSKLLEIISEIPWQELMLPGSKLVDFVTLAELFQDEVAAAKIVILGSCVGFWRIIDPGNLLPNLERQLKQSFRRLQLSIEIDPDALKCFREWIQLSLDALQQKVLSQKGLNPHKIQ
jgi:hypothetical protein